jgi:Mce-associated membrane protein
MRHVTKVRRTHTVRQVAPPAPAVAGGTATKRRPRPYARKQRLTAEQPAATPKAPTGPTGPTGPSRAPRRNRLLAGGMLVLLAAALVTAGLSGKAWWDQRQLDAARQQALSAARQACVNFVSISASTVDGDLSRIAAGATGDFKEQLAADSAQIRSAVLENKVDSRGTALRAAVVSVSRNAAVVLVAVDATVQNTKAPDGRLSHYRIQVNLARDGSGRWLVSQLQFVG